MLSVRNSHKSRRSPPASCYTYMRLSLIHISEESGSGGTGGGTKTVNVPAWSDGVSEQAQTGQGRFTDVPVSHWAAEAIEFLAEKSIISGYEGGVFKPDNNITREEFIKLAVDAFNISVSERTELPFNDVSETHWASEYIKSGLGAGVIKGISANEFGLGRPRCV